MEQKNNFLYKPRKYSSIGIWKNITDEQWYNARWQRENSIRSIDQLKEIIKLNPHQINELERTLTELKKQGKEPLRITPYYALLMQKVYEKL